MNNISDYQAHKRDEEWDAAEDRRKERAEYWRRRDPKRHNYIPDQDGAGLAVCRWCGESETKHKNSPESRSDNPPATGDRRCT